LRATRRGRLHMRGRLNCRPFPGCRDRMRDALASAGSWRSSSSLRWPSSRDSELCASRWRGARSVQSLEMTYYLTTPIYYVNATPHIGHAYTTIAADILVRHQRQRGEETFFLTGTDEHASKVYRVAEEQGLDAKTYVDQIAEFWRDLPRRVNAD